MFRKCYDRGTRVAPDPRGQTRRMRRTLRSRVSSRAAGPGRRDGQLGGTDGWEEL